MPTAGPFVALPAGACSFCHQDRTGVRALVAMPTRDASICDQCIALGWDILARDFESDPPGDLDDGSGLDAMAFDAPGVRERIDALSRRLAGERASNRAAGPGRWAAVNAAARSSMAAFRCSFCDAHRADVLKIVSGPGTRICDECIEAATSAVIDALRA